MATPCFSITSNINSCGVSQANFDFEQEALIGNFHEVKTKTRNSTTPTIWENLVMNTGTKFYNVKFKELSPMSTLSETSEEKSFGKTGKIEGEIVIYAKTPAAAYQKFILDNSRPVIILKQASRPGTSAYRVVLGLESGLKPAAGESFSKEKGGFVFKFMADFLTYPMEFLWAGSESATAAIEAALIVPGL